MTDNALSDAHGSLWECLGEVGGGMLGGGLVGGPAGAAGGGIACMKGLTDAEKAARSSQACWDKYELTLELSQDEFEDWMRCVISRYM